MLCGSALLLNCQPLGFAEDNMLPMSNYVSSFAQHAI